MGNNNGEKARGWGEEEKHSSREEECNSPKPLLRCFLFPRPTPRTYASKCSIIPRPSNLRCLSATPPHASGRKSACTIPSWSVVGIISLATRFSFEQLRLLCDFSLKRKRNRTFPSFPPSFFFLFLFLNLLRAFGGLGAEIVIDLTNLWKGEREEGWKRKRVKARYSLRQRTEFLGEQNFSRPQCSTLHA